RAGLLLGLGRLQADFAADQLHTDFRTRLKRKVPDFIVESETDVSGLVVFLLVDDPNAAAAEREIQIGSAAVPIRLRGMRHDGALEDWPFELLDHVTPEDQLHAAVQN